MTKRKRRGNVTTEAEIKMMSRNSGSYQKLQQSRERRFSLTPSQFSSVIQSCLTLCDPMNCSMPGLPVHHQLPEFTQTHVHWVDDAIQPSHPLSSPSPPALNLSQHQDLFQWVSSSHEVAKVLEFQLQHQTSVLPMNEHPGLISFRTDWLSFRISFRLHLLAV